MILRLELYTVEQLTEIVTRSAGILGIECEQEGAVEIARRSRGTPRIANRLLKRVRDFAQVLGDGVITREIADEALRRQEIDQLGLDCHRPPDAAPPSSAPTGADRWAWRRWRQPSARNR